MSLVEPRKLKTKSELVKVLANSAIEFVSEQDASDLVALQRVTKEIRSMIRSKKNIHVVLLEKKG
jgi:hypothetical protein